MQEIALLGPIELRAHGTSQDLGSLKERCVLAILSVECGRAVSMETLAARIWGQHPPPHARTTLTSYLSRLRRRLRQATGEPPPLASGPGGHTLTVDPDIVDLHRFRRLRRQAQAIAASGDDRRAVELLADAERLWRGEPLAGLPGDWMRNLRESLEEEQHGARLERIELELRLGRHGEVIGELYRLAASRPFDESVTAHLMTALYRCDRQADALTVYRDMSRRLAAAHGSDPGPRLQRLHEQILRRDANLAVAPRYARAGEAAPIRSLPLDIPDFTGRDRELGELTGPPPGDPAVASITVITGMAGVGKSTLALRAAHLLTPRFPDAQLHLDLCGHHPERPPMSAAAALAELLRLLEVPPTRIPADPSRRGELWRHEMTGRRAIVVLDDATSVEQIRPIAANAPSCRILVTSRRRLAGLPGARYLPLDVLPLDEARGLVDRIAGGHLATKSVDDIVRGCGRLPLVLRLAAARAAALAATGPPDRPDRPGAEVVAAFTSGLDHTAVQAAFELSYRALDDRQRRVFRRLGLSPCADFTEHTATAFSALPGDVVQSALDAMLDHHLVHQHRPGRLRMHDLIRDFARTRALAEDSGQERRRTLSRLLDYYLRSADRADRVLHPHRRRLAVRAGSAATTVPDLATPADAQEWMRAEWRNALFLAEHAIAHERKQDGALLVHVLSQFLETHGHREQAGQAQESALHAAREAEDPAVIGQLLSDLSVTRLRTGHHVEALEHCNEALAIYRALGDRRAEAEILDRLGIAMLTTARYREALAHCQEAQALYRSVDDARGEADTLAHAGYALWHLGRYEETIAHLQLALDGYRRIGDRRGEAMTLNNLGEVQRQRGYHRDAVRHYRESSAIFEEIGGLQSEAIIKNNIGDVHQYKGHCAKALDCYHEAIAIFRAIGDRRDTADVLNSIGTTHLLMGQVTEALIHFQRAEETAQEVGDPYQRARALSGTADAHQAAGRYRAALDHYNRALEIARDISDLYQEARAHEGIARTMLHLAGPHAARISWRQALDIFRKLGVPEAEAVSIRLQGLGGIAS